MGFRPFRITALAVLLATTATVGLSESAAGSYLAARQAASDNDFAAAARFFGQALRHKPDDVETMRNAALAHIALGQIEAALPIARQIEETGVRSQIAHMVVAADLIKRGEYTELLARPGQNRSIGPLVDGLMEAWAYVGADQVEQARAAFDEVASQRELRGFALYHKSLSLAMIGDFAGAEAIFSGPDAGAIVRTRRAVIARAEILSQLGRNPDALALVTDAFNGQRDPELAGLIAKLESGDVLPFTHVTSVSDGMAEVFFTIAAALRQDAAEEYTLVYSRVAQYLRPTHVDAYLLSAELFEEMEQYDLAIAAYKAIPADHEAFHAAELGRAEALRRSGRVDAALEVLEQLSSDYPEIGLVHMTLGDLLRREEKYEPAIAAYDRALEVTPSGDRTEWFVHYVRGIAYERLDRWDEAEADFRAALAINPDQPQVLNYLGYSMVEKRINLDEALEMIERAVAGEPNSGYIVDSLGWVLYRLGRYEDAVGHMERAVELEPVDPIVNDHLGDVYWAVGRKREAEFQWHRALSFDPEEDEAERIRRKLEVGLDQVLEEEGADPLHLVNDDG